VPSTDNVPPGGAFRTRHGDEPIIVEARDVTKTNTYRVDTFNSRDLGLLGYVDSDGQGG